MMGTADISRRKTGNALEKRQHRKDFRRSQEHWHGASENSWFTHIALEDWSKGQPEWLEPVAQEDYEKL